MAYIGTSPSNGVRRIFDYTATAGQTSFSGSDNSSQTLNYADSTYIDVFQNGILLVPSDYTATTGTTVVLDTGATVSDSVQVVAYDIFSVADTVSAGSGGSFGGNIGVGGTLAVTGTVTANGDMILGGTTPTLTIGDAGAEDAKIVFDGNAQDYHIGLDDSADTLVIGKGSALGTTTSMSIDANGIITKPLQPAFYAHNGGSHVYNIAPNAARAVAFSGELFDVNGDFASNTFTAPVDGKYTLGVSLRLENIDAAANWYQVAIVISNLNAQAIFDPDVGNDRTHFNMQFSTLTHMDANDTASITINQNAGTAQTDIQGDTTDTFFYGHLVS
jgi:hypothetical protein